MEVQDKLIFLVFLTYWWTIKFICLLNSFQCCSTFTAIAIKSLILLGAFLQAFYTILHDLCPLVMDRFMQSRQHRCVTLLSVFTLSNTPSSITGILPSLHSGFKEFFGQIYLEPQKDEPFGNERKNIRFESGQIGPLGECGPRLPNLP